uniref:Putative secreted protein n=1 Tax=Anopheles marajoara TaxID=58244 RepID=A0A2M4CCG3_9DIPT
MYTVRYTTLILLLFQLLTALVEFEHHLETWFMISASQHTQTLLLSVYHSVRPVAFLSLTPLCVCMTVTICPRRRRW